MFVFYIYPPRICEQHFNTPRMGLLGCFNMAVCKHLGLRIFCLGGVNLVQIKHIKYIEAYLLLLYTPVVAL